MKHTWTVIAVLALLYSCTQLEESQDYPGIFPDYVGVTVPEGIAPLHFSMKDGGRCKVSLTRSGDTTWYSVRSKGIRYKAFPVYTSHDAIDPYIAYRLIEPGYESWHDLSICQRELGSFREKILVSNQVNNRGCINCHCFPGGDPSRMLFHARGKGGGTVIIDDGSVRLLNIASVGPGKQGTYPAWHPDGRYVAFSSNTTQQSFASDGRQPIEVYDTASDMIVLDLQTDSVITAPCLMGESELETFPCWSEDGRTLFYCSAEKTGTNPRHLHYRLMAIDFENGAFVGEPRMVWEDLESSASFPRVRNGKLLFTRSAYGTFPIWHSEADLWMMDLSDGSLRAVDELNSPDTESYHSWSTNGSWVVFSSRRDDGRYTRLYIAHYDKAAGTFDKPFMLPQRKASHNSLRLKSYNIPEFVCGPVQDRQKEISKLFD